MGRGRGAGARWTPEEDARLHASIADGRALHEAAIVVGRSYSSTKEHWRWLNMTAEQKERRREHLRSNTGRDGRSVFVRRIDENRTREAKPSHVFEDARRRALMPRTLTSMIMGDPPPGYSALDRKRQEVRS